MATHDMPIWVKPDASGDVFLERLEDAMTLGTATFGETIGYTILAPTGSDVGFYGMFTIPQSYVGTPVWVVKCVVAEAANTLAFGLQQTGGIATTEAIDVAYEAEDLVNEATWTAMAAEDELVKTITITPAAAYVAGDRVYFFFYRDDSVDDQTGEIHNVELFFRFNDA